MSPLTGDTYGVNRMPDSDKAAYILSVLDLVNVKVMDATRPQLYKGPYVDDRNNRGSIGQLLQVCQVVHNLINLPCVTPRTPRLKFWPGSVSLESK